MNWRVALFNLVPMMLERVFQLISVIVLNRIILEYFGVTVLGQWQYSFAIIAIFMTVSWICGNEVVVAALNNEKNSNSDVLSSAFFIRLLGGFFAAFLMLLFAVFHNDKRLVFLVMIGLLLPVLLREALMIGQSYFHARMKLYVVSICLVLASIVKIVLAMFVGIYGLAQLVWLPYGGELIIGAVCVFFAFRIHEPSIRFVLNRDFALKLARKGFIIWLVLLFQQVWMKFDRYYFQGCFDENYYANYSSSMQLVENFYFIVLIIIQVVSPTLLLRYDATKKGVLIALIIGLLSSIFLSVCVSMCSDFVINFVYGSKLTFASDVLARMIWIVPFLVVNQIFNLVLIGKGKLRCILASVIFLLFTTTSLEAIFYNFFGLDGILLGMAMPLFFVSFTFFIYLLNLVKVSDG